MSGVNVLVGRRVQELGGSPGERDALAAIGGHKLVGGRLECGLGRGQHVLRRISGVAEVHGHGVGASEIDSAGQP